MDIYLVFWRDSVYGHFHLISIFSTLDEAKKFVENSGTDFVDYDIQQWKVKEKWDD